MENPSTASSPKFLKAGSYSSPLWNSGATGLMGCNQPQQSFRLHSGSGGQLKERAFDKSKASQKPPTYKEQTKPLEIKLHTQLRAAKRAGFNYLVETKLTLIEQQRKREEQLQKMIEEEEIRMLRKELIPRAQLMPFFDRPFFPQRSVRPLTIPREPCFHNAGSKCWRCISCRNTPAFGHLPSKL